MAKADVTKQYVDSISSGKYESRTSNGAEFEYLKDFYDVILNESVFPDSKLTQGLTLLILHHYALDDTSQPNSGSNESGVGSVASESVGDISISYAGIPAPNNTAEWKAWLMRSRWGQQFNYLMGTFRAGYAVLG